MLHCGHQVLKQALNFIFKLDVIVPRYESTIKSSFLVTAGIFYFFGTRSLFKNILCIALQFLTGLYSFLRFLLNFQLPNKIKCSQTKLKSSEIMCQCVKCQLMTSNVFDPNNFYSV